jgi:hypothetical protein
MTPNDVASFFDGIFMDAMFLETTLEQIRAHRNGLKDTQDIKDVNPVWFVLRTRPFISPCPDTLIDVRHGRGVPCPRYRALVNAVAGVLFDFGREFYRTFYWEPCLQFSEPIEILIRALRSESHLRKTLEKYESHSIICSRPPAKPSSGKPWIPFVTRGLCCSGPAIAPPFLGVVANFSSGSANSVGNSTRSSSPMVPPQPTFRKPPSIPLLPRC